jgi:hypothetical protein
MFNEIAEILNSIALEYDNTDVKVITKQALPEINVAGAVGPIEAGREVDLKLWIAKELAATGIVKFREEDSLSTATLNKIHWRETIQGGMQISQLPQFFYPKLRKLLSELREQSRSDPTRIQEHQKALHLSQDIITCRLKKIVNLASAPAQTNNILGNLTKEEQALYKIFKNAIDEWRKNILYL